MELEPKVHHRSITVNNKERAWSSWNPVHARLIKTTTSRKRGSSAAVSRAHDQGDCRLGPRAWWWMGSGPVGTSLSDSAPKPVVLRSSSAPCTPEPEKTPARKETIRKKPPFLDPRPQHGGVSRLLLPWPRPPSPASPALCPSAPLSRAVAMQLLHRRRG